MSRFANSSKPAISLVMAGYNDARFLRTAIASVLTQSFTDYEFIIVGSVDDSARVAASYSERDSRIKLIRQEHSGLIKSLNNGCKMARAQYIARFDSDDVFLLNRLDQQLSHMQRNPDIVFLTQKPKTPPF